MATFPQSPQMPTPSLDLAEAVDDALKTSLGELNELSDRDALD